MRCDSGGTVTVLEGGPFLVGFVVDLLGPLQFIVVPHVLHYVLVDWTDLTNQEG